jgi:hypothetical protein
LLVNEGITKNKEQLGKLLLLLLFSRLKLSAVLRALIISGILYVLVVGIILRISDILPAVSDILVAAVLRIPYVQLVVSVLVHEITS